MANIQYGIFKNSIPYARVEGGEKTLLLFVGGPGNGIPKGFTFSFVISGLKTLMKEYTIYAVSRKSGLTEGYTPKMMSDDYAEMIEQEFGGHVDLAVGISYGGMIAMHFAVDHADLSDHIVIAMATHKPNADGIQIDQDYAKLASQGKDREAGVMIMKALYPPGFMRVVMSAAMWLMAPAYLGEKSSTYSKDMLIEAKAEEIFDPVESLKRIKVPVLLMDGENDLYFQTGSAKEMAAMIPSATLILYPGKGHEISDDEQFGEDILEFVKKNPKK